MNHTGLGVPDGKGIDPPQSLSAEDWERYWLPWLKRLSNAFPKIQTSTQALTPVSVAANTTAEQIFTVTGLNTNDMVFVNKPSADAGLGIVGTRVTAANTLGITYVNATAGALTPTAETYKIVTIRI